MRLEMLNLTLFHWGLFLIKSLRITKITRKDVNV